MTDEPEGEGDVDTSTMFVGWLAGDTLGDAPDVEPAAVISDLPGALVSRLQEPGAPIMDILRRLCGHPTANALLPTVLSEQWKALEELLRHVPVTPPHDRAAAATPEASRRLVYLVLRLARPARYLSSHEVKLIWTLSGHDRTMLRHFLEWAHITGPENTGGWHFNNDPAPDSLWEHVAECWRRGFAAGTKDELGAFDWASTDGVGLVRKLLSLMHPIDVASFHEQALRLFETQLDAVIELADLPAIAQARTAAAGSDALSTFTVWAAKPMSLKPRFWVGEILPARTAKAFPLLPLEVFDDDPDDLRQFDALDLPEPERSWVHDEHRPRGRRRRDEQQLAIGWALGVAVHARGLPATMASAREVLQVPPSERRPGVETVGAVGLLWADVIQLVEYAPKSWDHRTEIRGVAARLTAHMADWPGAWAVSTGMILRNAKMLGTEVSDLLALAAVRIPAAREILKRAATGSDKNVRDLAQGLVALVEGAGDPGQDLRRWLADTAAQAFDGVPLFPHPLTPLARTWLGATEVEDALGRALRRAGDRFAEAARCQGGAREELLTGMLVTELEVAFRDLRLRLEAGGRPRLAQTIAVSHRPTTPNEEKRWGCDIALLLDANVPPSVSLRLAELIQVKKSESLGTTKPDKWRIHVPQLLDLLRMSESASYWLIGADGELACVTARWVRGLVAGRDALNQRTVTVGYNDIRHTAVALEQFLPELLLGTWLGSLDEETLRFAAGENENLRPRHIFEITVHSSTDR